MLLGKRGRIKLGADLGKIDGTAGFEPFKVLLAFFGQASFGVEQENFYMVVLFGKHTCNSQGVASVVAWPGKNNDFERRVPTADDGIRQGLSCPFHQINGGNRFVDNGVFVQLFQLGTC